jgi:Na+/phosphate symporter
MLLIIIWPLLVAAIGALIFAYAKSGALKEIGRLLFFVGAFWTVYLLTGREFRIGH